MADLKPCPFCGGEARIEVNVALRGYRAACKTRLKCGAMFEWYDTEKEAIEAWNTRKPMEAVVAELEKKSKEYEKRADENNVDTEYTRYYAISEGLDKAISIVRGKE